MGVVIIACGVGEGAHDSSFFGVALHRLLRRTVMRTFTANPDAPAAVTVPAEFGDCSAFDCDDWCADTSEQVVTEMAAFEAISARNSEVVVTAVPKSFCDGVVACEFTCVRAYYSAENCAVTVEVVFVIFVVTVLVEEAAVLDYGVQVFHVVGFVFEAVAVSQGDIGEQFGNLFGFGFEGTVKYLVGYIEINPFNEVWFLFLDMTAKHESGTDKCKHNCDDFFHLASICQRVLENALV